MGPWIETDVVLDDLVTTTRLNGMQVSEFKTSAMMYSIQRYIAEISRSNTLATGDILWLGTEYPVRDMVPGDEIEIEIRGIGSLRNKVVAERH
jgi:2-keto-4-pentenoate hydratase/2-oxohepta-3-ene-1,7-dioic acid hydratase in catechol pathway